MDPLPYASLTGLVVQGPKSAKRGKTVRFVVTVKNSGSIAAQSVRISLKGSGVNGSVPVASIAPGRSRNVDVGVRFSKTGKVKATIRATAANASSVQTVKTITVVR
ncbi:MAG: CARDB domain-containing protein [Solirubrobacterales bacterium]